MACSAARTLTVQTSRHAARCVNPGVDVAACRPIGLYFCGAAGLSAATQLTQAHSAEKRSPKSLRWAPVRWSRAQTSGPHPRRAANEHARSALEARLMELRERRHRTRRSLVGACWKCPSVHACCRACNRGRTTTLPRLPGLPGLPDLPDLSEAIPGFQLSGRPRAESAQRGALVWVAMPFRRSGNSRVHPPWPGTGRRRPA